MGSTKPLQQTMFVTVFDLRGAEFDIQKIFTEGAGKRFLEQFEVKLCFFLFHQADRHVQGRDDFLGGIDIAAIDAADVILIRFETFFDFTDFFLVHIYDKVPFFFDSMRLCGKQSFADERQNFSSNILLPRQRLRQWFFMQTQKNVHTLLLIMPEISLKVPCEAARICERYVHIEICISLCSLLLRAGAGRFSLAKCLSDFMCVC